MAENIVPDPAPWHKRGLGVVNYCVHGRGYSECDDFGQELVVSVQQGQGSVACHLLRRELFLWGALEDERDDAQGEGL